MQNVYFQPTFQGQSRKGQGRRSMSKVIGRGHKFKVKVVGGDYYNYPIESQEV